MRFSPAFIAAAAAYLAPLATADDSSSSSSSSSSASATSSASSSEGLSKPTFTPLPINAPFFEQFTDDWDTRWKPSHAKKETDQDTDEEWAYVGNWEVEEPVVLKGIEEDKGLVLKDKAAHHAISSIFPKKIDNKGKTLVVQYETKLQDELQCGGAYMKLLKDTKALKQEEFSNASPYVIMFGPDKCGTTNKVHFIFKHKNPKTGEYEEKHMTGAPSIVNDKLSHLYTLVVKPDNSFEVQIDGVSKKNGTLLDDFSPSVMPPKEIDDPKDKKPDDWVDEAKIPDPEAKKPEDWDEDAPYEIPDEEAEKPDDWLDDEPQMIDDPEAEKPEDWDDEEDGDWQPPKVPNPKCQEASGCGEWKRPTKKNPDYKGKWSPPMIDNPAYQGVWKPRKIKNPDFFEAKDVSAFEPIGALGIELWSMQANILFDNIYIGHSIDDATKIKEETWDIKSASEKAEQAANQKKAEAEKPKPAGESTFTEDPVSYIRDKTTLFLDLVQQDPLVAVRTVPEVAGAAGVLLVTILAILFGGIGGAAKNPQVQEKARQAADKASDAKDKAADAASSGVEKTKEEVNKRTTRSSAAAEQ
ncbi:MAG: hypothetical protein Q9162_000670 [Coniocarpon cinnabarinum]